MEYRERQLSWEAALGLYQQLSAAEREHLLDDGLPNIVEGTMPAEGVKQFVATRLFPLATLQYRMPQNPADLGVEPTPAP